MIILISGASHTGKTALAQKCLEKYHYPYMSIDHLKMGLIRSGQTKIKVDEDEKLTPYLFSIASEMIKTAIENEQNLVVEGCYIPFDYEEYFTKEYLDAVAAGTRFKIKNEDSIIYRRGQVVGPGGIGIRVQNLDPWFEGDEE